MYSISKKFLELVETYDTIIIFRHIVGDGDALGSQFGLKSYLEKKYSDKTILAAGDGDNGFSHLFPAPDVIEDDCFKDALGIVVDTANTARIDDERYKDCKQLIKIDHHLDVESYGDLEIVNEQASSASEIVVELLRELEEGKPLDKVSASHLYLGIISDTQSFSISTVSKKTFEMASYLLDSKIDFARITADLHAISKEMFEFKGYLSQKVNFTEHSMAYLTITNEDLKKFSISHHEAKENISLMKNLRDIEIWALFIEQEDAPGYFNASLRSHRIAVNDIAAKYGGGGHLNAAGIKDLDAKKMATVIHLLDDKTL